MHMLSDIFQSEDALELFALVLNDQTKRQEKLPFYLDINIYTNQYYLCTIVELIIKYYILFPQDDTIKELKSEVKTTSDYKTFFTNSNKMIAKSIQVKLGLTDMLHVDNKQKIIAYAYDHYIKEGYCFHSFLSTIIDQVVKEGLLPTVPKLLSQMKEVDEIFKRHNINNIFGYDIAAFFKEEHFHLTDSAAMAFYYALHVPIYFNNFIATCSGKAEDNPYMIKDKYLKY